MLIVISYFISSMCGLCGNYDGIKENDLRDAEGNIVNCTSRVTKRGKVKCDWPSIGNSYEVPGPDSPPG